MEDGEAFIFKGDRPSSSCRVGEEVGLKHLLDVVIEDGRRVIGLMDHDFLYWMDREDFEGWIRRNGLPKNYENGVEGLRSFYADVSKERGEEGFGIYFPRDRGFPREAWA